MPNNYRKIILKLRLIDNAFMQKIFEDRECAELLVRILMNNYNLKVVEIYTQKYLKNLQGKDSCLDLLVVDENGRYYEVEIQRDEKGAHEKRARYYSSLVDANILKHGEDYKELPENFVIFITETDKFKKGEPIYYVHRFVCDENDKILQKFEDQAHIIYVNSQVQDDTPLGLLMKDFFEVDPDKMNYEVLSERVRHFKRTEEGLEDMGKTLEDFVKKACQKASEEGREEGRQEGRQEEKKDIVVKLLKEKVALQSIVNCSGFSEERIREIAKKEAIQI